MRGFLFLGPDEELSAWNKSRDNYTLKKCYNVWTKHTLKKYLKHNPVGKCLFRFLLEEAQPFRFLENWELLGHLRHWFMLCRILWKKKTVVIQRWEQQIFFYFRWSKNVYVEYWKKKLHQHSKQLIRLRSTA